MARRPGGGLLGGAGNGGTTYNPTRPSPKPTSTYIEPPFMSFDPSIEAERRKAVRGLEDKEAEIGSKEHFAKNDLAHALANLKTSAIHNRQDTNRTASRGLETLGNQETDLNTKGARATQDFQTSLSNIARQFGQLGHRQVEAQNAAGVNDAGTNAAAAAARRQNQGLAEAPINTARTRENEDLATALQRIGTSRGQVGEDQARSLSRNEQEHQRQAKAAQRSTGREDFLLHREGQEAKVEEQVSQTDLLAQEIYAARAEHPSVFRHWKQEHPEAIANAEANAGVSGSTGRGGGTSAPSKKPKKKGGK